MNRPRIINPAHRYRATARRAVLRLMAGEPARDTLHRLRTNLRRLEAYVELIGDRERAAALRQLVSRLSRLRALQVFSAYLETIDAPHRDHRLVQERLEKARARIERKRWYQQIETFLAELPIEGRSVPPEWVAARLRTLHQDDINALQALATDAARHVTRAVLHELRLRLKTIRYQEEWANGRLGESTLLSMLKQMQKVLGRYEERAQFRKLAKRYGLKSRKAIVKDWRRERARARRIIEQLPSLIEALRSLTDPIAQSSAWRARRLESPARPLPVLTR